MDEGYSYVSLKVCAHEFRRLYTYGIGVYIIESFYNYIATILYIPIL